MNAHAKGVLKFPVSKMRDTYTETVITDRDDHGALISIDSRD